MPKKMRVRRSSHAMAADPYTLVVALSSEGGEASGQLYEDDGHSFQYQQGAFLLREFTFSAGRLSSRWVGSGNAIYESTWMHI